MNFLKKFLQSNGKRMNEPSQFEKKNFSKPKNVIYDTIANYTSRESYCGNLYEDNVIVYRCVNLIAQNIANIKYELKDKDGNILKDHEIAKLITRPNDKCDWFMMINATVIDLLLHGNAYLYKYDEDEIIRMNAKNVRIDRNDSGDAEQYACSDECKIDANDKKFLHIKLFNPSSPWKGMSPISSIEKSAMLYNSITNHNQSILNNGGRVSGALVFDNHLTDDQISDLRERLDSRYSGSDSAGRIMILEGGAQWKEMSISPKDMDFSKAKMDSAREIALAFGVPPVMLGMHEASSFTYYREARSNFWKETLFPFASMILSQLKDWLLQNYPDLQLEYDFSSVPVLSAQKEEYEKHVDGLSFLSIEEKRELCGYKGK
ncbi:phage portal protein [Candidatus Cytomitobacter indipagum]|uniref:Phage portal protein n=1 Tax=Candidatus Cytomitobacter indipagum TaxID=2601575 RepID=A0A5C0UG88_9PROT|nr:phage portal protein [Candidatus Cytomitobacter indipagum]QEK38054.1 phage portal protein [Candidatus Cytomitobacter indipagum]